MNLHLILAGIFFLFIGLASQGKAASPIQSGTAKQPASNSTAGATREKKVKIPEIDETTRGIRRESTVYVTYSPVNVGLFVPSKKAYSAGWILNPDVDLYAERIAGEIGFKLKDIELFEFSETTTSLNVRWYLGTNSFYLISGLGQRVYRFSVGDEFLARFLPAEFPAHIELLTVKSWVINLGLGNRWMFAPWDVKGLTFGVDWLDLYIPFGPGESDAPILAYVKDSGARDRVNLVVKTLRYAPTVGLKVDLGWAF